MELSRILKGWGVILRGHRPVLSIEITKECPLSCPGCYAFQPGHVSGKNLFSMADHKGSDLVNEILALVDHLRPIGVFLVGGEPLVRFRELSTLLPALSKRNILVEVVTSAVRPIPSEWGRIPGLGISVSIDGLQPEHDRRRNPATYERILKHIEGLQIMVHCTFTGQMARLENYLGRFLEFWSARSSVQGIRMSLYTPQLDEQSEEMLTEGERRDIVASMEELAPRFPKLRFNKDISAAYLNRPNKPEECTFARITKCVSADLKTPVAPCQLGGTPNCSECGCMASVGLEALSRHRLFPGIQIESVLKISERIGAAFRELERRVEEDHHGSPMPVQRDL